MSEILKQKIKSSTIKSAEYNIIKQELILYFHSGAAYIYFKVPLKIYTGLINAPSAGKYMWKVIRGKYEYKQK